MDNHHQQSVEAQSLVPVEDSGSAVELLDQTLQQALSQRASDIHFEPAEHTYRIRLRVDGVLHALPLIPGALANTLTARLKVLGNLDIAERRLPQDGQFSTTLNGQNVSFRIATLPCRHGEKVVLRLLHQVSQALDLHQLGMTHSQLAQFQQALNKPGDCYWSPAPRAVEKPSPSTVRCRLAISLRSISAAWKIRLRSRLLA